MLAGQRFGGRSGAIPPSSFPKASTRSGSGGGAVDAPVGRRSYDANQWCGVVPAVMLFRLVRAKSLRLSPRRCGAFICGCLGISRTQSRHGAGGAAPPRLAGGMAMTEPLLAGTRNERRSGQHGVDRSRSWLTTGVYSRPGTVSVASESARDPWARYRRAADPVSGRVNRRWPASVNHWLSVLFQSKTSRQSFSKRSRCNSP